MNVPDRTAGDHGRRGSGAGRSRVACRGWQPVTSGTAPEMPAAVRDAWVWGVYPRLSGEPLVASGAELTRDDARVNAGKVLAGDGSAAFCVITGSGGVVVETGHRGRSGGVCWTPATPEYLEGDDHAG